MVQNTTRSPTALRRSRPARAGTRPGCPAGVAPPTRSAPATSRSPEDGRAIVAQEARRYRTFRLDRSDLEQAGMVGVAEAEGRFQPAAGPFGPYARLWVRKEMQRAIAAGEFAASLPAHYPGRAVALRGVLADVHGDTGAAAVRLGIPRTAVAPLMALVDARGLDDLLPGDDARLPAADSPEDEVLDGLERQSVRQAVDALPSAQRAAVLLRFGFDGGGVRSHREIARRLGLSDFTVRRLVADAFRVLRPALAIGDRRSG